MGGGAGGAGLWGCLLATGLLRGEGGRVVGVLTLVGVFTFAYLGERSRGMVIAAGDGCMCVNPFLNNFY